MRFVGGKRAKNHLKLPVSVCFTLYLRKCRSYHQGFDNDIYINLAACIALIDVFGRVGAMSLEEFGPKLDDVVRRA